MTDKILTEKEIDQKIETATFVASKTVVDMLATLKDELKEELVEAVENKIETKVNGKIKRIDEKMDAQNVVLNNHTIVQQENSKKLDELKPLLQIYRDREGAKRYLAPVVKWVVGAATFIGALYVIKDFLTK